MGEKLLESGMSDREQVCTNCCELPKEGLESGIRIRCKDEEALQ